MFKENSNWQKRWQKLKNVYRFQIIDEQSYDVKLVVDLNRINIITISGILLAFFTLLNFLLIAYTPLKQYIPGYGTNTDSKKIKEIYIKMDELEDKIAKSNKYDKNLKNILSDKIIIQKQNNTIAKVELDSNILVTKTVDEQKLITEIEKGLRNAELLENINEEKVLNKK